MKWSLPAIALAAAAAAWSLRVAQADVPAPAIAPLSWELEFDYKDLKAIRLQLPGDEAPVTYWYLLYTVTNRTGKDQIFVPDFALYTDTGDLLRTGRNVPPSVYSEIKKLHGMPLLRDTGAMTGKILQGEDNAKHGVAIWQDFDPQASKLDIFVGGLTGEAVEVKLPKPIKVTKTDIEGNKVEVEQDTTVMSKTLNLRYLVPAEAAVRARTGVEFISKDWVMR